ncbi:MAG: DUF2779 domain-containing protein [Thiotrichales bacterium]
MTGLSKSRIQLFLQCPKRLWLRVHRPELAELSAGADMRLRYGSAVGEMARALHAGGVLIDAADLASALRQTARVLAEPPRPVFEATFEADRVLVQVDLLLPSEDGYRLVEVKSSTSVKDYHLDDAAVQAWVAQQAGTRIRGVEIAHLDNTFVYRGDGDYRGLFHYADAQAETAERLDTVPDWISGARATLAGAEPDIEPGDQCGDPFECPFQGYCSPPGEEDQYPLDILPYGKALAAQLAAEGYTDLRDVPLARLTNPKHQRVWRATTSGRAELDPEAAEILGALAYPRYYLDFETIAFPVPAWADTRPYQQIPFQWSCHLETAGIAISHAEFLAADARDPRRAFIESLFETVADTGPVIVYNAAFERKRLEELAEHFPDLAPRIEAVIDRLFDLLPVARAHYYHPDMRGSWSIKAVLPTIAPELAYDDLDVADGQMAQDAYAEMIHAETTAERREELRKGLLEYCRRDTEAMVRVFDFFVRSEST